jgi:hypothetical protein
VSDPVLLERREVGRKTPRDGRLELSSASAERIRSLGAEFTVHALGRQGVGRLDALDCTCGKGGGEGANHTHHFAQSELFRELAPGDDVRIELDEAAGALRVEPA